MVSVSISGSGGSGRLFFGGFLANSACRIDGGSSIREITVIGCSGKRISAEERACPCSIHALTHLARFLLIFLLCLFVVSICNFLSNMFSLRSGSFRESGVKKYCLIITTVCISAKKCFPFTQAQAVKACWALQVVFVVCSSAAFCAEPQEM